MKLQNKKAIALVFSITCVVTIVVLAGYQLVNKQKELDALMKKEVGLEQDIKEKDSIIGELNDNVFNLSDTLEKQQETLIEHESKIEVHNTTIEELEKDKKKLSDDINQKDNKIKELSSKKENESKQVAKVAVAKTKAKNKPKPKAQAKKDIKVATAQATAKTMTMNTSAYTAKCDGCTGRTFSGTNVRNTIYHSSGHRIAAVDPSIIPLGTLIEVNGVTYISDDIGGAIKGQKLDLLVGTKSEARNFGRQNLEVKILN